MVVLRGMYFSSRITPQESQNFAGFKFSNNEKVEWRYPIDCFQRHNETSMFHLQLLCIEEKYHLLNNNASKYLCLFLQLFISFFHLLLQHLKYPLCTKFSKIQFFIEDIVDPFLSKSAPKIVLKLNYIFAQCVLVIQ